MAQESGGYALTPTSPISLAEALARWHVRKGDFRGPIPEGGGGI